MVFTVWPSPRVRLRQRLRLFLFGTAVFALLLLAAIAARAASDVGADSTGTPAASAGPVTGTSATSTFSPRLFEYLWVVRTSLTTRESCVRAVERAKQMGVRGIIVQVVGRGDAYYRSDLLPRAEAIREPELDPLGTLLPLAHEAGMEVHAWMNCMLVWSAPAPPRDPRHVLNAHPEWGARLKGGGRMAALSERQRSRLGVEGVFLAPAHPGVRTWVAQVAREIATRYRVDGIHLDYIRNPSVATGYDPTTRARFALRTGVDPERLEAVPAERRAEIAAAWQSFQRDQVTATVREVRDTLSRVAPGLPLSAAVLADTLTAGRVNAQSWNAWIQDGLLDRAYVMCYAAPVQTVLDQMVAYAKALGASDRVVPGIAVYNTRPAIAALKIQAARELGYPVLAVYSYDSLERQPAYWTALHDLVFARPAGAVSGRPD